GLLALAAAARALPDRRSALEAEALTLWARTQAVFGHPGGGYVASESGGNFLTDPMMHLLEAALAWVEVGEAVEWTQAAAALTVLFETRLFRPQLGAVREAYDAAWTPIASDDGAELEPGHQFEWAFLLGASRALIGDRAAHPLSAVLLAAGERGVEAGLARDGLDASFRIVQPGARLWPQCERLRAWISVGGQSDAARVHATQAALSVLRYLTERPAGAWADQPLARGATPTTALASTLYHLTGAIRALEMRFGIG
ncbi:MAG TPA: AGE family epimerase/isomerase, partial [Caulobacteraceae bacterium]|nr:AGE family epimerase/isomerase [Caulobacteraceae bacterium]